MVIYNQDLFREDPLYKLHFEDFVLSENIILHLGDNPINRIRQNNNEKHILIEFEEPNKFLHPISHHITLQCEAFYDKILTINPTFVKGRNKSLGRELYQHIFFPYSLRYLINEFDKNIDVIYTGNKDYFNICSNLNDRSLIWIGTNGNRSNVSHDEKINLISKSRIAISHSIVDFKDVINFMDTQKDTVGHINGIFEQHKARTIEAAFNKAIIIHIDTGQKLIEEFFEEGKEFLYYREGIFEEVLNNYNNYKFLAENAYNKAFNNYTTKHFFNKYLKPLI
jgi:hypothetical protein